MISQNCPASEMILQPGGIRVQQKSVSGDPELLDDAPFEIQHLHCETGRKMRFLSDHQSVLQVAIDDAVRPFAAVKDGDRATLNNGQGEGLRGMK